MTERRFSQLLSVMNGVLQGFGLRPLLFLLFVKDSSDWGPSKYLTGAPDLTGLGFRVGEEV